MSLQSPPFRPTLLQGSIGIDILLSIRSQAFGAILVARQEPQMFTEQELQLLATVGAALALSLRNAETHHQS